MQDASNTAFLTSIRNAEAIFIGGGDQANYANLWPYGVRDAINYALSQGAAIGGTSAGLAILGGVAYTAQGPNNGITATAALKDPLSRDITLWRDSFLDVPLLRNTVTETHFLPNDKDPQGRMGRIITFLGVTAAVNTTYGVAPPYAIAVSGNTALLVETRGTKEGEASVVGAREVYFLAAPAAAPTLTAGTPLTWSGVSVVRVAKGGKFNVKTWSGMGRAYTIDVTAGKMSLEGNNDFY